MGISDINLSSFLSLLESKVQIVNTYLTSSPNYEAIEFTTSLFSFLLLHWIELQIENRFIAPEDKSPWSFIAELVSVVAMRTISLHAIRSFCESFQVFVAYSDFRRMTFMWILGQKNVCLLVLNPHAVTNEGRSFRSHTPPVPLRTDNNLFDANAAVLRATRATTKKWRIVTRWKYVFAPRFNFTVEHRTGTT